MSKDTTRRDFVKNTALTLGALSFPASSYARIVGANDRINFATIGLNGRGKALTRAALAQKNTDIIALCDVDTRSFAKHEDWVKKARGHDVTRYKDIRRLLENKDIDAVSIATPEHWHAPMTIMSVQADKHVYIEKPCSHNPREGELLIKAQKKYNKMVIQMGNQQRSAATSQEAVKLIKEGKIGRAYFGKAWYANTRGPIGEAKVSPVPDWLDWELWQGPAPREEFKNIYVPYKWHWFWKYGTGEVNNNGTHEIDICRWALGVDYPTQVSSSGGRFHYDDSWEFYDTQIVNYQYADDVAITWEGRSCNGKSMYGKGRGAMIFGTEGSILIDRNEYIIYDKKGNELSRVKEEGKSATLDTVGAGFLDKMHMRNFVNAIRINEAQNSPIHEGAISNTLCHLGNYAQKLGRTLNLDQKTGRILKDRKAMQLWSRDYEKGWEPKV